MIQRYDLDQKANSLGVEEFQNGRYVLYADHLLRHNRDAELNNSLLKQLQAQRDDHLAALAEKDKEIDKLRLYYNSTHGYESAREKIIKVRDAELTDLRAKLEKAVSLLDGVEDIVEIFGFINMTDAQREWREKWLSDVQDLVRIPFETTEA